MSNKDRNTSFLGADIINIDFVLPDFRFFGVLRWIMAAHGQTIMGEAETHFQKIESFHEAKLSLDYFSAKLSKIKIFLILIFLCQFWIN